MKDKITLAPSAIKTDLLIYQTTDGAIKIDVHVADDTVWLSLNQLAELFQRDKSVISRHIKNVFDEGELHPEETVAKSATVQNEGGKQVTREIDYYNLDVIISVGYRVKSQQGVRFRIWATQRLKQYIVKGFALNDERFKSGNSMNYFSELQERIREIRLSELFGGRRDETAGAVGGAIPGLCRDHGAATDSYVHAGLDCPSGCDHSA